MGTSYKPLRKLKQCLIHRERYWCCSSTGYFQLRKAKGKEGYWLHLRLSLVEPGWASG